MKLKDELSQPISRENTDNTLKSIPDKLEVAFLWLVAIVVNIKHIFFSFGTDPAYCVVMSYRLVRGERMFIDMWEPHQTSALIPYVLEKMYIAIFKTTDGIVLWLHLWGTLFFAVTAVLIIRTLKPYVPVKVLHFMAVLFMVLRSKNVNTPDYANMCIIFSTLFWLFLVKYLLEKRIWALTAASLFAAAATFAYPSYFLLVVPATVLLFIFSEHKVRDILIAAAEYIAVFVCFAACILISYRVKVSDLIDGLANIAASDSHYDTPYKGWLYFKTEVYCLIYIAVVLLAAYFIHLISRKKWDILRLASGMILVISPMITMVIYKKFRHSVVVAEWIYYYLAVLIFAMIMGIVCFFVKKLDAQQKFIYLTGMLVGIFDILGCMVLTNLPLITIMAYTALPVMCSFIPICNSQKCTGKRLIFFDRTTFVVLCVLGVVSFQQTFLAGDQVGQVGSIFGEEQLISAGPEKGLGSAAVYCDRVANGMIEWNTQIGKEDAVLISNSQPFQLLAYMYSDAEIANYSTISTPSFNPERLEAYWTTHPKKRPTVIALSCYGGEEIYYVTKEIRDLIATGYELDYAGTYWNFYRKSTK